MLCVLYVFKTDIVNHNYCAGYARRFSEALYRLQEARAFPPGTPFLICAEENPLEIRFCITPCAGCSKTP